MLNGQDYSTSNPLTVTHVTSDMALTAVFSPANAVGHWRRYE